MKWIDGLVRQLLLFGFLRNIQASEHAAIATPFHTGDSSKPGGLMSFALTLCAETSKPDAKSIQERLSKLRKEQLPQLKRSAIYDQDQDPPELQDTEEPLGDDEDVDSDMHWTVAADRILLTFGFGRPIIEEELQRISKRSNVS